MRYMVQAFPLSINGSPLIGNWILQHTDDLLDNQRNILNLAYVSCMRQDCFP